MTAPLLEVKSLGVRFGGLAAVSELDLMVQPGTITAVIGPNGAGKTTLFNAISGVCAATTGSIRFAGAPLERTRTRRATLFWIVLGLSCGLFALLFVANPDRIWSASVRSNFVTRSQGFAVRDAWDDFLGQVAGKPLIERRAGRYFIVTPEGQLPFGATPDKRAAFAQREQVLALGTLAARGGQARASAGGAEFVGPSGEVLLRGATMAEVGLKVAAARHLAALAARARALHGFAFLFGAGLGVLAGYAIFRQSRRAPSWVATRGIARTFQNIRLFKDMSVLENVVVALRAPPPAAGSVRERLVPAMPLVAIALLFSAGLLHRIWRAELVPALLIAAAVVLGAVYLRAVRRLRAFGPLARRAEQQACRRAEELLDTVGLRHKAHTPAKSLPYGEQRRLEIARALATDPKLLLLDEPAAGMNPRESSELMELIRGIRDQGITVLLIEHHMPLVMGISDRITVLQYGRKIAEGTPAEVQAHPDVVEAYLGREVAT